MLYHVPPDEEREQGQREYAKEKQNLLSLYKPGDRYPLIGAVAGILAGFINGLLSRNVFLIFAGVAVGGVAGAFIGSAVGSVIIRLRKPINSLKYY